MIICFKPGKHVENKADISLDLVSTRTIYPSKATASVALYPFSQDDAAIDVLEFEKVDSHGSSLVSDDSNRHFFSKILSDVNSSVKADSAVKPCDQDHRPIDLKINPSVTPTPLQDPVGEILM